MKRLLHFIPLIAIFVFIFISCEKQDDSGAFEPQPEYKAKGPKEKIRVCHKDEYGKYIIISINQNALPAHLNHGDLIAFPNRGTYTWNFVAGNTYEHTMEIDKMTHKTFNGYGVANFNPAYTWVLEDGTFDKDGNVSFTITYTGAFAGYTWYCTGTFTCGEGAQGTADGEGIAPDGQWYIEFTGTPNPNSVE